MDENRIEILDSHGKPFKSMKTKRQNQFTIENVWKICEVVLAVISLIFGALNIFFSTSFSNSCEEFYGIDRKYFNGSEMFRDKVIIICCALLLSAYPFLFNFANKQMKSKIFLIFTSLALFCILFVQNFVYLLDIIERFPLNWLKKIIFNCFTIGVVFIVDIILTYFFLIRNHLRKNKEYKQIEKNIFMIGFSIYVLIVTIGIFAKASYQINDKKTYEVIQESKAIIANYDGKFVVMECSVEGETLILKKGSYSLEEMTGIPISYHEYKKVICE